MGVVVSLPEMLPPLVDRERLPPREVARDNLECCRCYREYLRERIIFVRDLEARQNAIARIEHYYQCRDWLHAAQGGEGRDEYYWRHALKRLRELLGEEDYYAGKMPVLH